METPIPGFPALPAPVEHAAQVHAAVRLRVLVVEDQPVRREKLVYVLRGLGIRDITVAADGHEGLAALDGIDGPADIVICDLKMDGMDGIEFIRHLAGRDVGGVIIASAMGHDVIVAVEAMVRAYGLPLLGTLSGGAPAGQLADLLGSYLRHPARGPAQSAGAPEATAQELASALANDEFIPYYQPKIALADRKMIGVEALARWRKPDGSIVAPGLFIAAMERHDLIDALTERILHHALAQVAAWAAQGHRVPVAVNCSALTLGKTATPGHLNELMRQHALPPSMLTIEVTESALSHDAAPFIETLSRLRLFGFGLSIDDFGTGYSSMQQLARVPFTELKIDRSFVTGAPGGGKPQVILESMLDLARRLKLRSVAEGVETDQELALVESLGCDAVQGYLFERPQPAPMLQRWL